VPYVQLVGLTLTNSTIMCPKHIIRQTENEKKDVLVSLKYRGEGFLERFTKVHKSLDKRGEPTLG